LEKPIFIIGSPRSGTTMVLEIMAFHEELAWVSNLVNYFPKHKYFSVLNRLYNIPILGENFCLTASRTSGSLHKKVTKCLPRPSEPWGFWNEYLSSFQWQRGGPVPPRRRTEKDISQEEIQAARSAVDLVSAFHGKKGFLSKYTDLPRITYLRQVFPDALFLHILRDDRAVAASYHKKMADGVFGNWKERDWWIRGWPEEWRNEWLRKYNTVLTFAVFQWKFFVHEIWKDAEQLPKSKYKEINYRDIINLPLESFNTIFDFCQLKESKRVNSLIIAIHFEDRNKKMERIFRRRKADVE